MSLRIAMVGHVDNGKSTLIGRLLADTGQTLDERKERVQSYCTTAGRKFEFAFLLDALEEEQSQGITIDVTEVNWKYEGREYTFVDTPGHREFLKKMIGGASKVDAVVILVDATVGPTSTFHRQMKILDLLGVANRIILINKMDLAAWSASTYEKRAAEVRALCPTATVIPCAAWHGENLLGPPVLMPWYHGPSLVDVLRALETRAEVRDEPTRFFVQDVYRFDDKRIIVGRVEAGALRVGDVLHFHPGGQSSRVTSIEVHGESRERAVRGEAVGFCLADPLYIDRGFLAYTEDRPPLRTEIVAGDLFWLDPRPLRLGERLKIKMGTRQLSAEVAAIEHEIDGEQFTQTPSDQIAMFGRVRLRFDEPWAFDNFETSPATGRFVAARDGLVLGGGRFVQAASEIAARLAPGSVLWLSGLSGAGKSTIARALEQKLRGQSVFVLDGDALREGLCSDLGFSEGDRRENLRRAAEVAKLIAANGSIVIAAFITPYEEQRTMVRAILGERLTEVFVDCPLEICERRDVKGLYAKARDGRIGQFTGVSAPFESPTRPDFILRTDNTPVDESVRTLLSFMTPHNLSPGGQQL